MNKSVRRVAIVLAIAFLALAGAGMFVRGQIRARPTWYRRVKLDDRTQHLAASSMNDKLIRSYGVAQDAQAAIARAAHANPTPTPAPTMQPALYTVELTEAEINAFFNDWDKTVHWRQACSKYFQDPVLILEDHELILAAGIPEWNTVVSLHFFPRIEDGKLCVGPVRAMAGTLPLPKSYVEGKISKVDQSIGKKMPEYRRDAEIGPHGWATPPAVNAAMGELVLDILHDRPAEPVLMLPELERRGPDAHSLPVKITAVDVADKSLLVTFRLMTPDEREALLQHIRGTGPQLTPAN